MTANSPIPAIVNAIYNAVGVRITDLPMTPEKILHGVVLEDSPDLPYHAVSEFWFDDNEARVAAFATPEGKAAGEDAAAHCSSRMHLLIEEKVIIE